MVALLFVPCPGLQRQGSSQRLDLESPWTSPEALPLPSSHSPGALFKILTALASVLLGDR